MQEQLPRMTKSVYVQAGQSDLCYRQFILLAKSGRNGHIIVELLAILATSKLSVQVDSK